LESVDGFLADDEDPAADDDDDGLEEEALRCFLMK